MRQPSSEKEKAAQARRRELGKTQTRLEKQITRAEAEIADQERRIKERDTQLADPTLYQNYTRWSELHEEQTRWKAVLEHLTAKWESASKELEDVRRELAT
jgi:ATP-binding cassette subfamily F protein 3